MLTAEELILMSQTSGGKNSFALGTIPVGYTSGDPAIILDGAEQATVKTYKTLSGYTPSAGDRVLLASVSGTFVVLGAVGATASAPIALGTMSRLVTNYTADSTYNSTEQNMLNAVKTDVNNMFTNIQNIHTALVNAGLMT